MKAKIVMTTNQSIDLPKFFKTETHVCMILEDRAIPLIIKLSTMANWCNVQVSDYVNNLEFERVVPLTEEEFNKIYFEIVEKLMQKEFDFHKLQL